MTPKKMSIEDTQGKIREESEYVATNNQWKTKEDIKKERQKKSCSTERKRLTKWQ